MMGVHIWAAVARATSLGPMAGERRHVRTLVLLHSRSFAGEFVGQNALVVDF